MIKKSDRGSILPELTNSWLDVNSVETEAYSMLKIQAFEGLEIIGQTEGLVKEEAGVEDLYIVNGISKKLEEDNRKFSNLGYMIQVQEGGDYKLRFRFSKENPLLIDRIKINVKAGHRARILLDYLSDDAIEAFHNGSIQLDIEEDGLLELAILQRLNEKSLQNLSVNARLKDGAILKVAHLELGSERSNYHFDAVLEGAESEIDHQTAYLTMEEEKLDLFYNINFTAPFAHANIDANGAVFDKSIKSFRGTLNFLEGCYGSVGDEEEFAMLMSNEAKSIAVPILLCHEEAVEGNHASSAGRLDEGILFYLMSRGISRDDAESMIIEGRMRPVLDMLDDDLRDELAALIHKRIMSH